MNPKSDLIFIEHILESVSAIEDFSKELTLEELLDNRLKQSAIIREIEVIGEATKNISKNIKEEYPKVLWTEISGTRDKMIHHYFGVDLEIVWEIINNDIPKLKNQMIEIKRKLQTT